MDLRRYLAEIFQNHPGKVIGAGIGLIWGLLVIWLGFFWTVFLTVTTLIGYWFGKKIDEKTGLLELLERWLPPERP